MGSARFLSPTTPGGLLSIVQGLLTSNELLIVQAIENGTYFVINETPTGAVNGSNVTFTLASTPNPATSLEVFWNGVKQILNTDYTLSGATITFTIAPDTGYVRANYILSPV